MRWLVLFFFLPLALGALPAGATSFYIPPFPRTVQDSPVIVRGKIGGSRSDWGRGPDGVKRLYTFYDVQVEEVLKGTAPASSLTMREMGGEKDGIGMEIPGASHFDQGEDVVVTLSPANPDGTFDVRGLMMGKFNIREDDSGNEVLSGPALNPPGQERKTWTLDSLRKLIRSQGGAASAATAAPSPKSIAPASPVPVAPRLLPSPTAAASQELAVTQAELEKRANWNWVILGIGALAALLWLLMRTRK